MLFCRDEDEKGKFWVDQNHRDQVTTFEPCDYCRQLIENPPLEEHEWRSAGLCDPCHSKLEITTAIANVRRDQSQDLEDRVREMIRQDEPTMALLPEPGRQPRSYEPPDLYHLTDLYGYPDLY